MADIDVNDVLDHMQRMEQRASEERREQTRQFREALTEQGKVSEAGFRALARAAYGIMILLVLGVLALAGVQVTYGARPASLDLTPADIGPASPTPPSSGLGAYAPVPDAHAAADGE